MQLKFLPFLGLVAAQVPTVPVDPADADIDPKRFLTIADGLHARLRYLDPTGSWSGSGGWKYNHVSVKLQYYGCYCFIDENYGAPAIGGLEGNKGDPIDAMDKLCLDLYRCHRCIYDFDHPADVCSVESAYRSYFNDKNGEFTCLNKNSACQKAQCECDKEFVHKIADLWTNRLDTTWSYDKYYWKFRKNKMNTFSYKNTCVSKGGRNNNADQCCGLPGNKRPYNSMNADCCADGTLAAIGTC